ncbi:hypothetical protein HispidOSU_017546, partial [Sigmodon hispidus]
ASEKKQSLATQEQSLPQTQWHGYEVYLYFKYMKIYLKAKSFKPEINCYMRTGAAWRGKPGGKAYHALSLETSLTRNCSKLTETREQLKTK